MRNVFAKLKTFLFVLVCCILCDPLIVKAASEGEEGQFELNAVEAVIALIVLVVVAYKVYHLMYDGTALIGTRAGIRYEKGRMLAIPCVCGVLAAGIVIFLLRILFKIFIVLLIIAAIIGVIVFICKMIGKMVGKKGNASEEIISEQSDSKTITDDGMAVYENEIQDIDDSLRSIISKLDIHEAGDETGTPITKGWLLQKARKNLGIPASENVYLIHDDTIFGTCKKGFAICESGMYSRRKQNRHIPWAEFKTMQISNPDFLHIGDDEYSIPGKIENTQMQDMVCEVLVRIQESIE